jgi:hypothetical protein
MRIETRAGRLLALGLVAALLAGCDRDPVGLAADAAELDLTGRDVVAAATNDDFDDAVVVTALPFTDVTDTSEATTAIDDPFCVGQGPTVWYTFTPTVGGFYEANTFGSEYDTTLGAYLGTRGDLVEIACNDDTGGLQSRVVVELEAGQTVHFMVGAYASGPGGPLVFTLDVGSPPPPPPPPLVVSLEVDRFGSVDPRTGIATLRGTVSCSRLAFVNLFGMLETSWARLRVEGFFSSFLQCDGTVPWEADVRANVLLSGGPVSVSAQAFFFDPRSGESTLETVSATVNLRGGGGGQSGRGSTAPAASPSGERTFTSLGEMMRHDSRLKRDLRSR